MKIPTVKTEVLCDNDADTWNGVIVRAATWRKVMAVLKAADAWWTAEHTSKGVSDALDDALAQAMLKLDDHLERK